VPLVSCDVEGCVYYQKGVGCRLEFDEDLELVRLTEKAPGAPANWVECVSYEARG